MDSISTFTLWLPRNLKKQEEKFSFQTVFLTLFSYEISVFFVVMSHLYNQTDLYRVSFLFFCGFALISNLYFDVFMFDPGNFGDLVEILCFI